MSKAHSPLWIKFATILRALLCPARIWLLSSTSFPLPFIFSLFFLLSLYLLFISTSTYESRAFSTYVVVTLYIYKCMDAGVPCFLKRHLLMIRRVASFSTRSLEPTWTYVLQASIFRIHTIKTSSLDTILHTSPNFSFSWKLQLAALNYNSIARSGESFSLQSNIYQERRNSLEPLALRRKEAVFCSSGARRQLTVRAKLGT